MQNGFNNVLKDELQLETTLENDANIKEGNNLESGGITNGIFYCSQ